jgi:hypothetical protein
MSKDKAPVVMKTKPVYDPAKKYTWPKDAKFELTGDQFGLWLNSVRGKVTSQKAMEYRFAFEANDVIEKIMAVGVQNGVITELDETKK